MGADRPFPGFDAVCLMADPVDDDAWSGRIDLPRRTLARLFLGEERPTAPIPVRPFMGRAAPADVVWTESYAAMLLGQRVVDLLTAEGFTGWTTWPATLLVADGSTLAGYHGLAITGRCGPIDYGLAELLDPSGPLPIYGPPFFDPESWDGSDLFASGLHVPFVVPEVRAAFEQAGVANVSFLPLTEILAPRVIDTDDDRADPFDPLQRRPPGHREDASPVAEDEARVMDRAQLFALVDGILPSHHPRWQLRGVMLALLALGHPRRTLEGDLSAYAARLREEGREEDWDVIAEASDFLNGWAGASSIPE